MKACIFDLDGVIVDTARYHFLAWKRLAGELGVLLTEEDNERLKGVGRIESLEIILSIGGIKLPYAEMVRLAEKKNNWFVEYIEAMRSGEIYPGAKELFHELKHHSVGIGLASSSKNAQMVLNKLGIIHEFHSIVDGTMIEKSKPDPEIFLKSADMLGVKPADCLVIEDAVSGIEAALQAGMKCVGIGNKQKLKKANWIVDHIGQLNYEKLSNL